ncbi:MAG TPA: hypothetical protein VK213_13860 [Bacteroidales bacterium]|nr:hypothetical protein [Bacteroidales bacterium]
MARIIFLHHSTGDNIWRGGTNRYLLRFGLKGDVQRYFDNYNARHDTNLQIEDRLFPRNDPYGWKNYPFDYYNIWVRHAGPDLYMNEPTLEILTKEYDVIVFKHCYPVGRIMRDTGIPDIGSEEKRLENYKLQYNALKKKMHSFPGTKFILWTPPAILESKSKPDEALRTQEFHNWITNVWNENDDNIYIWDFYNYETRGGLYLKDEYADAPGDNHPGRKFSKEVAPLFSKFVIDTVTS